jgi:hypothetical protein
MEEKEMKLFSWFALFLVTGTCFLAFTVFLFLINELYSFTFLWTGLILFGLAIGTGTMLLLNRKKITNN